MNISESRQPWLFISGTSYLTLKDITEEEQSLPWAMASLRGTNSLSLGLLEFSFVSYQCMIRIIVVAILLICFCY
jgi:hypothetical protein